MGISQPTQTFNAAANAGSLTTFGPHIIHPTLAFGKASAGSWLHARTKTHEAVGKKEDLFNAGAQTPSRAQTPSIVS